MANQNVDQKMTPEVALGLLDQALCSYQGTRRDHQLLQASMGMLAAVVSEWKKLKGIDSAATPNPEALLSNGKELKNVLVTPPRSEEAPANGKGKRAS
jgi:hypothetical protein